MDLDNYDKAWLQIRRIRRHRPLVCPVDPPELPGTACLDASGRRSGQLPPAINTARRPPRPSNWTARTSSSVLSWNRLQRDENGWWIDDISIEANVIKTYTIGFADDMEGGDGNWTPAAPGPSPRRRPAAAAPGAIRRRELRQRFRYLPHAEWDGRLTVPESTQPEWFSTIRGTSQRRI